MSNIIHVGSAPKYLSDLGVLCVIFGQKSHKVAPDFIKVTSDEI